MLTKEEKINKITEEIEKVKNNKYKVIFFTYDTKGNPSGSLQYIYKMAMSLKNSGLNVEIAHQEDEFVGPFEWLGEKYKEIPHHNIDKENVEVSPSDILVVPELFSNVFYQLKDLPCKKVILFQNFEYLTEFMPINMSLNSLGITDAITTTENQKKYINQCFPFLNVRVLQPEIGKVFRTSKSPKKLIVNIVSKDPSNINKIIKPFYWKYGIYKWISFKDLRGLSQEEFSDSLRNNAITVWIDDDSNFGYSALEALKSGTILMGKVPNNISDWMYNENGKELNGDVIWFDNIRNLPDMLASIIRSWTFDVIPDNFLNAYKKIGFTPEDFSKNCLSLFKEDIVTEREKYFEKTLEILNNN